MLVLASRALRYWPVLIDEPQRLIFLFVEFSDLASILFIFFSEYLSYGR